MAEINLRSKGSIFKDGSSLLALGLTAAAAKVALGDPAATGGWYIVSYLVGGSVGREAQATKDYDESGEYLGTTTELDEWVVKNTAKQTDDATLALIEYWQTHELPMRYPLPAGADDEGKPLHQLYYHPAMTADIGNDEISTARGQRNLPFTARGDRKLLVRKTVDLTDQQNWPDELADALDTAFPAA